MGPNVRPSADALANSVSRELLYTICPVLVASNVALELGWIDDELLKVGASATYLRSLPGDAWKAHYDHSSERLIRDGGNSPAVWAHADLTPTVLVGLTQAQPAGKVIVRADADLYRLEDLKGRRVALYRSLKTEKIDHRRATTEHGWLAALALAGLKRADVAWVDIDDADAHQETPARTPAGIWAQRHFARAGLPAGTTSLEAKALADGAVDALYDYSVGTAERLVATGKFKVLDDLDRYPDWTLKIANAPRTITVSRAFAETHRDVVVAYLRAALRAGGWINANPSAAADVFGRTTIYPDVPAIDRALRRYDLVPNLSAQNLAGLAHEAAFLKANGYIAHDVDVADWADASFLDEARATL